MVIELARGGVNGFGENISRAGLYQRGLSGGLLETFVMEAGGLCVCSGGFARMAFGACLSVALQRRKRRKAHVVE